MIHETTITYKAALLNGKVSLLPANLTDSQKRSAFLVAQYDAVAAGEQVTIRGSLRVISKDADARHNIRETYFDYIDQCISEGPESWTKQFTGNRKQKQQMLHSQLKQAYCTIKPDHYCTIYAMVDGTVREVQTVFTVSDRREEKDKKQRFLTTQELRDYCLWAKQQLLEITKLPYKHATTA